MSGEKQDFTNSNEGEPFFLVNEFLEKEKNELEGILEVVKRKNMKQLMKLLKHLYMILRVIYKSLMLR